MPEPIDSGVGVKTAVFLKSISRWFYVEFGLRTTVRSTDQAKLPPSVVKAINKMVLQMWIYFQCFPNSLIIIRILVNSSVLLTLSLNHQLSKGGTWDIECKLSAPNGSYVRDGGNLQKNILQHLKFWSVYMQILIEQVGKGSLRAWRSNKVPGLLVLPHLSSHGFSLELPGELWELLMLRPHP